MSMSSSSSYEKKQKKHKKEKRTSQELGGDPVLSPKTSVPKSIPKLNISIPSSPIGDSLNSSSSSSPSSDNTLLSDNPFNDILEMILRNEREVKATPRFQTGMTPRRPPSVNLSVSASAFPLGIPILEKSPSTNVIHKLNKSEETNVQSFQRRTTSNSPSSFPRKRNVLSPSPSGSSPFSSSPLSSAQNREDLIDKEEKDDDIVPSIDVVWRTIKENGSFINFRALKFLDSVSIDVLRDAGAPKRKSYDSNSSSNYSFSALTISRSSEAPKTPTKDEVKQVKEILTEILAKYRKWLVLRQKVPAREPLYVPDDVRFMLRIHMLRPTSYKRMCKTLYGKTIDLQKTSRKASFEEAEALWKKEYGLEPLQIIKRGKAIRDFEAETDGELSFKKGDTVIILETDEESGWCGGEIAGRVGYFPIGYVEI